MRLFTILSILLLLLTFGLFPAYGAPPKPRPYAGTGILIMRPPAHLETDKVAAALVVYREPAIGRIAEMAYGAFPSLAQVIVFPAGELPIAVMGKKGAWIRIAYDGAGREGWIETTRGWDYVPWDEFLPGRTARLLPGLKKQFYSLRQLPEETAAEIDILSPQATFRIVAVSGGWAQVAAGTASGWLRWRDGDGRLLITDCALNAQQKY